MVFAASALERVISTPVSADETPSASSGTRTRSQTAKTFNIDALDAESNGLRESQNPKFRLVDVHSDTLIHALHNGLPRVVAESESIKIRFRSSETRIQMKAYHQDRFAQLRAMWDASAESEFSYLESFAPEQMLALGQLAHSGSSFYYTMNRRFVVKTLPLSEMLFLRRNMDAYTEYMLENSGSYITRFYGLYRIKITRPVDLDRRFCLMAKCSRKEHTETHYVVVMSNTLFYHQERLTMEFLKQGRLPFDDQVDKYDMKGRGLKHSRDASDLNRWLHQGRTLVVSPSVKQQLYRDADFLGSINVNDYSMLVGIHRTSTASRDLIFSDRGIPIGNDEIVYVSFIDILSKWNWPRKIGSVLMPGASYYFPRYMRPKSYNRRMHDTIDAVFGN